MSRLPLSCHFTLIYMWHQADHPAIRVVPALGFAAFLGNFSLTRFGHTVSEAHHLFLDVMSLGGCCDIVCDVTAPHVHGSCDLLL